MHVTFSTEHPTFATAVLVRWVTKILRVGPTDRNTCSSQLLAQRYLTPLKTAYKDVAECDCN